MKNSEILIQITNALDVWVGGYGGDAEFAGDAAHLFSILSAKPGGVRAAVWLRSEKKRGEYEESGIVDLTIHVILSRARGFRIEKSETHILDTPSGPPLINLVEEARDLLRGLDFTVDETEWTLDYKGFEPFTFRPDDKPLDAYDLEFSLGCQLPVPTPMTSTSGLHAVLASAFELTASTPLYPIFATEIYDTAAAHNSATGIFTAPVDGRYLCEFFGYIGSTSYSALEIGFCDASNNVLALANDSGDSVRISTVISLVKGATLKPYILQQGGSGLFLQNITTQSFFKIHRLF